MTPVVRAGKADPNVRLEARNPTGRLGRDPRYITTRSYRARHSASRKSFLSWLSDLVTFFKDDGSRQGVAQMS